jgi:hypothetical protein
MLLPTDKILGEGRGDPEQFIRYVKQGGGYGPVAEWTESVAALCDTIGIDRAIAWFIGYAETEGFQSRKWLADGNSCNWDIKFEDPYRRLDGYEAALLHVATIWALVGKIYAVGPLRPYKRINRTWIQRLTHEVHEEPNRPDVVRLDDLNIRYRGADGKPKTTWSWDERYVNAIISTAALAPVHIPNQQYWHGFTRWHNIKTLLVVKPTAVYEGPTHANRRLLYVQPGDKITFIGSAQGHSAGGNATWYVTGGTTQGFVHSGDIQRLVAG